MDANIETIINYILTESDAPATIRRAAYNYLRVQYNQIANSGKQICGFTFTPQQFAVIEDHVRNHQKIYAIKYFREYTGCSLRDAKESVEKHFGI